MEHATGVNIDYELEPDERALCRLSGRCETTKESDFAIVRSPYSRLLNYSQSLTYVPLAGVAVAVVHNVVGLTDRLVLTRSVLARIFRRCTDPSNTTAYCTASNDVITYWNDTAIKATNPPDQWPALDAAGEIKVILLNGLSHDPLDAHMSTLHFKSALREFDNEQKSFADQTGFNDDTYPWPSHVFRHATRTTESKIKRLFQLTPGSISYVSLSTLYDLEIARSTTGIALTDRESAVFPSVDSIRSAIYTSLATHPEFSSGKFELPQTYPISHLEYFVVRNFHDLNSSVECAKMEIMLEEILEFEVADKGSEVLYSAYFMAKMPEETSDAQRAIMWKDFGARCASSTSHILSRSFGARLYLPDDIISREFFQQIYSTYWEKVRKIELLKASPHLKFLEFEMPMLPYSHPDQALALADSQFAFNSTTSTFDTNSQEFTSIVVMISSRNTERDNSSRHTRVSIAGIPFMVVYSLCNKDIPDIAARSDISCNSSLNLDIPTLHDMFAGRIRYWNDSRIRSMNPIFTEKLPFAEIVLISPPLTPWTFAMRDVIRDVSGNQSFEFPLSIANDFVDVNRSVRVNLYSVGITLPSMHASIFPRIQVSSMRGVTPSIQSVLNCVSDSYSVNDGKFELHNSQNPNCYYFSGTLDLLIKTQSFGIPCNTIVVDPQEERAILDSVQTSFVAIPASFTTSSLREVRRFLAWVGGERVNLPSDAYELYSSVRNYDMPFEARLRGKKNRAVRAGMNPEGIFQSTMFAALTNIGALIEEVRIVSGNSVYMSPDFDRRNIAAANWKKLSKISCASDVSSKEALIDEDFSWVERGMIITSLFFYVLFMMVLIFMAWWVYKYSSYRIVYYSSPLFLYMMIFGAMVGMSTILPLSVQDGSFLRSYGFDASDLVALDFACVSIPFLYSIGFSLVFGPLLTKTWRMLMVFTSLRIRKLTNERIILIPFTLLIVFYIINIAWVLSPMRLRWDRVPTIVSSDDFVLLTSVGFCTVSSGNVWVFIGPQFAIMLLLCVVGLVLAFKTRKLPSEFQESTSILLAIVLQLQNLVIVVPVLSFVSDRSEVTYLFKCIAIFLNTFGCVAIIIAPKMYMVYIQKNAMAVANASNPSQDDVDQNGPLGGGASKVINVASSSKQSHYGDLMPVQASGNSSPWGGNHASKNTSNSSDHNGKMRSGAGASGAMQIA